MNRKTILTVFVGIFVLGCIAAAAFITHNTNDLSSPQNTTPPTLFTQIEPNRSILPEKAAAEQITENMTADEVYSIMGPAQRDIGSGSVVLEWDLNTDEILRVSFIFDASSASKWYVVHCAILANS